MLKEIQVRYGQVYTLIPAIIGPALLVVPFILLMQKFHNLSDWKVWLIILSFLGALIFITLQLVLRVYPRAILSIHNHRIQLNFKTSIIPWPSTFSFPLSDILSLTRHEIGEDEYYVVRTKNPNRKFQVSAASGSLEDTASFREFFEWVNEQIPKDRQI